MKSIDGQHQPVNIHYPYLSNSTPTSPEPSMETMQPCAVCSGKISGFHFGVFVCRACASFFRRSVLDKRQYLCRKGNRCAIQSGWEKGMGLGNQQEWPAKNFKFSKSKVDRAKFLKKNRKPAVLGKQTHCDYKKNIFG